jgi:hypothetical protein
MDKTKPTPKSGQPQDEHERVTSRIPTRSTDVERELRPAARRQPRRERVL